MRKLTKITALLLCAALLLSMVACTKAPAETTVPTTQAPTTVPTEPPAEDVYAAAREALDSAEHVSLELVITTLTTVAGDEFSEQSTQTLTYKDMGTEEAIVSMEEDLLYSVHNPEEDTDDEEEDEPMEYKELWYQGVAYAELDSTYRYQGPVAQETLSSRYTPVVLLNAELYGSVTSETTADGTTVTFAEATALESWVAPEEAELVEASGTALISPEGVMQEMRYTVTYIYGNAMITKEVTSKPMETPKTVTAPANPDTYESISYVDALRTTISAPAMLFQSDSITASSLESMFCQAAGFMRNQSNTVNVHGRKDETIAKIEIGIFVRDYGTGESQELDQEEIFRDGKLTTVTNDGLPSTQNGVAWEEIRDYASEMLLYGLVAMDFWQDITMTDMGSVLLLEYTLNDNFGNTLQNSICQMLWNDPSFLIALADDYRNEELTGYLSLDKYNGLPVAAGYYYKGIHTIEGQEYELTLQLDQSYEAPAKGAYMEITEEMPEEAEPENKATPLFYHVTGEDGQEMWLLGTIHVGDERTAYLPEEIYNAFAASDALALECDTEAFDEQVEEDDKLSEEVSNHYFYSGGVTIESLLPAFLEKYGTDTEDTEATEDTEEAEGTGEEDAETADDAEEEDPYAEAVKFMKAIGSYNMNMPYAPSDEKDIIFFGGGG